jgi:tetratricopeptide (TPR) repeat protein
MQMTLAAATERLERARLASRLVQLPPVGLALLIAGVAADHGGYFATTWGWVSLVFLWAAAIALVSRGRIQLSPVEIALIVATTAFVAWIGLSIAWSAMPTGSVDELERALVYPAGVLALMLIVRSRSVELLLGTLLTGIVAVAAYALASRLFPDRLGSFDSVAAYRLSEPVGYWNALGLFAGMGALLALGFTARARTPLVRALAGASLPILLATLYFTFSRGGSIAFGFGLLVALAFDTRRLQLIGTVVALAPACALAVWLSSRKSALTTLGSPLDQAVQQGHRLALELLGLTLLAGLVALALAILERRVPIDRSVREKLAALTIAAVVAGFGAVFATYGGPHTLVQSAIDSFKAPPAGGPTLTSHLLSLSNEGRLDTWDAAWRDFVQHPLLGSGAGSYEEYWLAHRPNEADVIDAHSLYMETLGETGAIGLVLLVLFLAVPFAAFANRRQHVVPFALAAYAAYLLGAGVDWHWEITGLTMTALCCGVAPLIAGRPRRRLRTASTRARVGLLAVIVLAAAFSLMTLVGNRALSSASAAADADNYRQSERDARSAQGWLPWSSEPWQLLGEARLGLGDLPGAARYLRQAVAKDPNDWTIWEDLGWVTNGRESKAAFAQARRLNPLNPRIPVSK